MIQALRRSRTFPHISALLVAASNIQTPELGCAALAAGTRQTREYGRSDRAHLGLLPQSSTNALPHPSSTVPPALTTLTAQTMGVRDEVRASWLQRFEVLQVQRKEQEPPAVTEPETPQGKPPPKAQQHQVIDLSDEDDDIIEVQKGAMPRKSTSSTASSSTATTPGSQHPPKRPRHTASPLVIDLDLSSDEDLSIVSNLSLQNKKRRFGTTPVTPAESLSLSNERTPSSLKPPKNALDLPSPPFKPIHNRVYDTTKLPGSITLSDIVGSQNITKSFLFSFQYNMQYILDQYTARDAEIMVLYQAGTLLDCPLRLERNVIISPVDMEPFTSHHPKLIINFYKDGTMKIWLLSCNLSPAEFEMNNQMYWESPFLHRASTTHSNTSTSPFQTHLLEFLQAYGKSSEPQFAKLIDLVSNYDFSSVKGDFISSVRGNSSSSSTEFGYMALFRSLQKQGYIPDEWSTTKRQLLYQTSSIASPYKWTGDKASNIFTHIIAPLVLGEFGQSPKPKEIQLPGGLESVNHLQATKNCKLLVVFPTEDDIKKSKFGVHSGGWSHYNPTSKTGTLQSPLLNSVFHKPFTTQRGSNTSHTKFLMMSSDNFKSLDWILFTSHNMSKQAWGSTPKRGSNIIEVPMKNYETGILITRKDYDGKKLIPLEIGDKRTLAMDQVPIFLPFRVPPKKYGPQDQPWCYQKFHAENND